MAPSLIRWSGPASVLGAVLLVAWVALDSVLGSTQGTLNPYEIYNPLLYAVYNLLFDAALLLFVVGLMGLYARRAERSGWLGRIGLFLALVATSLVIVSAFAAILVDLWPALYAPLAFFTQPLAFLCLIAGLVLLGVATTRMSTVQYWISSVQLRGALLILMAGLTHSLATTSAWC